MSTPISIRRPRAAAPTAFAVAIAAVVASALAAGQAAPPKSAPAERAREVAVLAVLGRELDGGRSEWFFRSRLRRTPEADGGHVFPEIPISCGNSKGGHLEAARALDLAAKLGAAYGATAAFEVDETRLPIAKRLPIMDGDTFTPLAGVAVEVIARLDAASEGEDVDLSLLESGSTDVWPLPPARDGAGRVDAEVVAGGAARFERARKLRFEVRADAKGAGATKRGETVAIDGAVRSTAGRVALLFFPIYATTDLAGTGTPSMGLRIVQGDVAASSTSAMAWLPSTFDAKQPFTVEADFGPGVWTFGTQLLATAPDR